MGATGRIPAGVRSGGSIIFFSASKKLSPFGGSEVASLADFSVALLELGAMPASKPFFISSKKPRVGTRARSGASGARHGSSALHTRNESVGTASMQSDASVMTRAMAPTLASDGTDASRRSQGTDGTGPLVSQGVP